MCLIESYDASAFGQIKRQDYLLFSNFIDGHVRYDYAHSQDERMENETQTHGYWPIAAADHHHHCHDQQYCLRLPADTVVAFAWPASVVVLPLLLPQIMGTIVMDTYIYSSTSSGIHTDIMFFTPVVYLCSCCVCQVLY